MPLNSQEKYNKLDTEDMYHKIIHMPEHILNAYFKSSIFIPSNFSKLDLQRINKVVICGMGGSAIAGDIFSAIYSDQITIQIVKDYRLPKIDENTFVIGCSYSGQTEETLSCIESALNKTKFIAGISTGGKLEAILKDQYYYINIPLGYPPRSAIAFLFFSLIKIAENFKIISSQKVIIEKIAANLMIKAGAIARSIPTVMNFAKSNAEAIHNKIPIIYSVNPQLAPVAYRWKCQINENSKYPCFYHTFPEMNHNEIEGWESKEHNEKFIPIFLRFFEDIPAYEKRLSVFKQILNKENIEYLEFYGDGESLLSRIFSLIYLGDMISYYLAILTETNPTTINHISFLKDNL